MHICLKAALRLIDANNANCILFQLEFLEVSQISFIQDMGPKGM